MSNWTYSSLIITSIALASTALPAAAQFSNEPSDLVESEASSDEQLISEPIICLDATVRDVLWELAQVVDPDDFAELMRQRTTQIACKADKTVTARIDQCIPMPDLTFDALDKAGKPLLNPGGKVYKGGNKVASAISTADGDMFATNKPILKGKVEEAIELKTACETICKGIPNSKVTAAELIKYGEKCKDDKAVGIATYAIEAVDAKTQMKILVGNSKEGGYQGVVQYQCACEYTVSGLKY